MKNKKKKNCQKGYSCGFTCISVYKVCLIEFPEGVSVALDRGASFRNQTGKPYEKPSLPAPKFTFQRDLGLPKVVKKSDKIDPFDLFGLRKEKNLGFFETLEEEDVANHLLDKGVFKDKETAAKTVKAIREFTEGEYEEMRKNERDGKKDDRVEAINKNIFDNDEVPVYEGELWRGLSANEFSKNPALKAAAEMLRTLKEGDELELDAMSSFTSDIDVAKNFANNSSAGFIFNVKSNTKGKSIEGISKILGEKEVLVPKGSKYKIIGVSETKTISGKVVKVFEIEEI